MLKRIRLSVEQVKPIYCSYPETIVLIDIKNVNVIVAQAGWIRIVVKITNELFCARVILV